jgi:hypothetical protein
MKKVFACLILIFAIVSVGPAGAQDAKLTKDTGPIVKVTPKEMTFEVKVKNLSLEYLVNDETKIYGPDKKPLKDGLKDPLFKVGAKVTVTYKGEMRIAKEVWLEK